MLTPVMQPDAFFSRYSLDRHKHLVAAVSGGGDSLALLLLLSSFLSSRPHAPRLTAVTVDHGLRPEAAAEARFVADFCRMRGIAHRIMVWRGQKPSTGISEASRTARMALLAEAARDLGADVVFTGHTRDDQAETVFMRGARGNGRGAAGIAPAALHEGATWFVRPLLSARRTALRAFLAAEGVGWIDDPSNDNPAYERVRARQALSADAVEDLAVRADTAARERIALGERAAGLIEAHLRRAAPGLYRVDGGLFTGEDETAALYAFRLAAAMAGGTAQLAGAAAAEQAFAAARSGFCATLSRAVFDVRRAGIHLHRERRNLPAVEAGSFPFLWDGRYWIETAAGTRIAAFGSEARAAVAEGADGLPQDLVFAGQSTEPADWRDGRLLGAATGLGGMPARRVSAPWARLLPSFDMAPANALTRLALGKTVMDAP
ncbi:tRNA lysidine(34) synthetase TilS [Nitratireductor pacificus]|uniref:tRNA(Ile)-lysidine synthase n=1 Tax=Nitratireductor pacificus pht-3B TaxID=391937 RepID=K2MP67_9HYPH|nr:tRNA lysidine(34) synthetase TilS [Nitratireductor pacificus]EKF19072.1 tRNA(Ile)-lysidine synthetase [Nitratireductor pacificus pht-3B]